MKQYKPKTQKIIYKVLIFSVLITHLIGCTSTMTETQKEREARIESSSQSQNGRFVNPNGVSSSLFSQEMKKLVKLESSL